jgi:ABC-type antimicrobial peptide transport system permease subunit
MRIPIRLGRSLEPRDERGSLPVALVSEAFVRQHLADPNPIGCTISFGPARNPVEIIGVVADVSVDTVQRESLPAVYVPDSQQPATNTTFLVRTSGDPMAWVPEIRDAVGRVDPNVPMVDVRTQESHIERGIALELLFARVTGGFGLVALLLASIGLYGLMSHTVSGRIPEVGIRMAVGARRDQVLGMVMFESMKIVFLGVILGLGAAWVSTRLITSMLYGIEPNDPATIVAIVGMLVLVTAGAAFLPARRASNVDPTVALRHE